MKFLLIILLSAIQLTSVGQILIKGTVQNESGNFISGCMIREINRRNGALCDENGQFSINVKNNKSIIEILFIGYYPLKIKVDTIKQEDLHVTLKERNFELEEVLIIAPNPPYLEIGYKGLITNQPFGLHTEYSMWANKFRSSFDVSTKDFKNYFYSFDIRPYRFGKSKFYKVLNFNVKGFFLQKNSDIIFCNQFFILNKWSLNIGVGNGKREFSNNQPVFLTGIQRTLISRLPFLHNYLSVDFVYNRDHLDWKCFLYTELYSKSYRNLSLGVGYQDFYKQKDISVSINYKYYFIKR